MSQRAEIEDKNTVVCLGCTFESIDPEKKPGQKYPARCPNCGRTREDNQRLARKKNAEKSQKAFEKRIGFKPPVSLDEVTGVLLRDPALPNARYFTALLLHHFGCDVEIPSMIQAVVPAPAETMPSLPESSEYPVVTCWGHGESEDTETWNGSFKTREEAIEDGRGTYHGAFFVRSGYEPDPASFLPEDRLIDLMLDQLSDSAGEEAGDAAENWPREVTDYAKQELGKMLRAWVRKNLPVNFWIADGAVECIEPETKG